MNVTVYDTIGLRPQISLQYISNIFQKISQHKKHVVLNEQQAFNKELLTWRKPHNRPNSLDVGYISFH